VAFVAVLHGSDVVSRLASCFPRAWDLPNAADETSVKLRSARELDVNQGTVFLELDVVRASVQRVREAVIDPALASLLHSQKFTDLPAKRALKPRDITGVEKE
jgi:hypothetical protein